MVLWFATDKSLIDFNISRVFKLADLYGKITCCHVERCFQFLKNVADSALAKIGHNAKPQPAMDEIVNLLDVKV